MLFIPKYVWSVWKLFKQRNPCRMTVRVITATVSKQSHLPQTGGGTLKEEHRYIMTDSSKGINAHQRHRWSTTRSLPRRPTSTHPSDGPSPCCKCSETGWFRAFSHGRRTSWFLPSSAETQLSVNPSHTHAVFLDLCAFAIDLFCLTNGELA